MRGLSALTQAGLLAFMLILLSEVMSHSIWGGVGDAPSTLDFAVALFGDWWLATVILGLLLAMAMIGASYRVRDERLANLIWDMEGEQ